MNETITLKGHYKFTLTDIHTGEVQVLEYDNIVTAVCWAMIANNMFSATPTNSMLVNKAALGTSTTTPATSQTQLVAEVYRNNIASKSNIANIGYATAYFNATETSGTYREAAIFSNGTATANSGVMVSRVAINVTKTTSQTLTIDWTLQIT